MKKKTKLKKIGSGKLDSKSLAIIYTFFPYVDTSGIVFAKRIQSEIKENIVVITNQHVKNALRDDSLAQIVAPYLQKTIEIKTTFTYRDWKYFEQFIDEAFQSYLEEVNNGQKFTKIYSRSMSVVTHLVAYKIKQHNPSIKWIAEFSDPILKEVDGNEREVLVPLRWLEENNLSERIYQFDNYLNLFFISELLVYLFADEVVFTNSLQKKFMLSYMAEKNLDLNDIDMLDVIHGKSVIKAQPTLPKSFYDLGSFQSELSDDYINIGYFGNFNIKRNFEEFFLAWNNLPAYKKEKIRLYIYTPMKAQLVEEYLPTGLSSKVFIYPSLRYLDFLNALKHFDYLLTVDTLVNDTLGLNPFLPSKVSDYLGVDNNAILALVEEGSPLEIMEHKRVVKLYYGSMDLSELSKN